MSIINQVNMSVREVDMIGKSKKKARNEKVKAIHSYKTKKEVLKISKQFANWARSEHGVKNLHDLTQEHYKAFMDSKAHTSLDYRRGIETNLRLLQQGLNKRSERFGKEKTQFTTDKRSIRPRGRIEGVSDRSLQIDDINTLKANVSSNVRNSIELMHNLGLRVSGSVSLKVKDINFKDKFIGVTEKGGKYRTVPIPKEFEKKLAEMVKDKAPDDRVVPIVAGTVQNGVSRAAEKGNIKSFTGTHGFRHTYARNRVEILMSSQEKDLFNKCVARYIEGKEFDYGIYNQELYDSMVSKMDQVHKELGHGPNRFDLAVRYMR